MKWQAQTPSITEGNHYQPATAAEILVVKRHLLKHQAQLFPAPASVATSEVPKQYFSSLQLLLNKVRKCLVWL